LLLLDREELNGMEINMFPNELQKDRAEIYANEEEWRRRGLVGQV
jgi:hypothetical protein